MKKVISILTTMLLLCFPAYSQDESLTDSQTEQKSKEIEIYFDLDSYAIDPEYQHNRKSLSDLADLISWLQRDSLTTISKIEVDSYASPDGGCSYNDQMTFNRTNAISNYLTKDLFVPDSLISKKYSGIDWNKLAQEVELSDMKHQKEVLHILKTTPIESLSGVNPDDRWRTLTDSLNNKLMELRGGEPYRYMMNNFFPQLRRSTIATIYFITEIPAVVEDNEAEITSIEESGLPTQPLVVEDTTCVEEVIEPTAQVQEIEPTEEPAIIEQAPETKTALLALKTNLLYDIAAIPTIEVEVPIGERWSVAGEWIFPWWVTSDNAYALQLLSGQIEGKYWFGDRTNKPQLTGWFAGLYAGGGLYDLQWDGNGYQGEFYIAAGLSAGYAHTINKSGSLRMEYSLGVGYLSTEYRYYEGMDNNEFLVWQHDGKYTWIGPTKAKVSLVWMLGKKGGKR